MCPAAQFGKKDAPPPAKGGKKGAKKAAKKGGKKVAAKKAAPQRPEGVGIFRTGVCTRPRAYMHTPTRTTYAHAHAHASTCRCVRCPNPNPNPNQAEPNIVQKIFAMPFIGGGKGVELGSEYEL